MVLCYGSILVLYLFVSFSLGENAKDLFAAGKMIAYNSCLSRWAYPVQFFHAMRESTYFTDLLATCDLLVREQGDLGTVGVSLFHVAGFFWLWSASCRQP